MTWSVITGLCSLTLEVHHRPAAFMCLWKPLSRKMRASETRSHTTYQYYKHHPGSHFPSFFVFLILVLCLTKAPIVHDRISIWWKLKAGVALLFHLGGSRGERRTLFLPGLWVSVGPVPHAPLHWVMSSSLFGWFLALFVFVYFLSGWLIRSFCSPHPSAR